MTSKAKSDLESERASERESKRAREQESKRASERGERERENDARPLAVVLVGLHRNFQCSEGANEIRLRRSTGSRLAVGGDYQDSPTSSDFRL
jgi:hypothetical protein